MKRPQRNLPLALIGGLLIVAVLYVFANVAYLYVLSPLAIASVAGASSVATEVARDVSRPRGGRRDRDGDDGVDAGIAAHRHHGGRAHLVCNGEETACSSGRLGEVSARTHVPVNALLLQGAGLCVLALTGSFDTLTDYVIFAAWIFYALNTASVFIFRRRLPHAERPYRTIGYPVVPVLFLLAAGWLIVNTFMATPRQALIGVGIIALGLPLYWSLPRVGHDSARRRIGRARRATHGAERPRYRRVRARPASERLALYVLADVFDASPTLRRARPRAVLRVPGHLVCDTFIVQPFVVGEIAGGLLTRPFRDSALPSSSSRFI